MPLLEENTLGVPSTSGLFGLTWKPSFGEVVDRFWKDESVLGAMSSPMRQIPTFNPVENYDALADIMETEFEVFITDFAFSKSPQETEYIKGIVRERMHRQAFYEQADFMDVLQAGALTGVLDPINLLMGPTAGAIRGIGTSLAKAARVGAAYGFGQATVTEMGLAQADPTRTFGEAAGNVALTSMASAAILPSFVIPNNIAKRMQAQGNQKAWDAAADSLRENAETGYSEGFTSSFLPLPSPEKFKARGHADGPNVPGADAPRQEPPEPPRTDPEVIFGQNPENKPAFYNRRKNQIFLDREQVAKQFSDKAWLNPKIDGVEPLDSSLFPDEDAWVDFVLRHEHAHSKHKQKKGESTAQYENRINRIALHEERMEDPPTGYEAYGVERFSNMMSPQSRLINSENRNVSKATERLVTTRQYTKANFEGIASEIPVTEGVKEYNHMLVESLANIKWNWLSGRLKSSGQTRDPGMLDTPGFIAKDLYQRFTNGESDEIGLMSFRSEVTKTLWQAEITGAIEHSDMNVTAAAKQVRGFLDFIGQKAVDAGVLRPDQIRKHYVNRMYEQPALRDRRQEFVATVLGWQRINLPAEEVLSTAELNARVDLLLGSPDGMDNSIDTKAIDYEALAKQLNITEEEARQKIADSPKGIFKSRSIEVPDYIIRDFLSDDIDHLLRTYVRLASADIEIVKRFGSLDMKQTFDEIRGNARMMDESEGAEGDDSAKFFNRHRTKAEDEIKELMALRDVIRGTYKLPDDPFSWQSRLARGIMDWNNLTMMGNAAVMSLTDVGKPIMANGLEASFQGMRTFLTDFETFKISAKEAQLAGTAMDLILQTRSLALTMTPDLPQRYTRLERGLGYLTNAYFIANVLSPWNYGIKSMDGVIRIHRVFDLIEQELAGTISQKNLADLRANYIDADMSKRIWAQFERHGDTVNGLRLAQSQAWTDKEALHFFRRGLARAIDTDIVTPQAGDLPLFSYQIMGRLLMQYKSFVATSLNSTLIPGLQMAESRTLFGMMMMVWMGGMVAMLRDKQNGIPTADGPLEFIIDGIDHSGVTSWLGMANSALEAVSNNQMGVRPLLDIGPHWDTQTRWKVGSVLGPTAGQAVRATDIVQDLVTGEVNWRTAENMRGFVPGGNLFYTKMGNVIDFNRMIKTVDDFRDLE